MKKTLHEEIKQTELQMLKLKKKLLITEQMFLANQLAQNKRELKSVVNEIKQAVQKPLPLE